MQPPVTNTISCPVCVWIFTRYTSLIFYLRGGLKTCVGNAHCFLTPLRVGPSQSDHDPHVVSLSKRDPDTSYFSYYMGHVFQTDFHTVVAYGTRVRAASPCHDGCQLDRPEASGSAPNRRPRNQPANGRRLTTGTSSLSSLLRRLPPCSLTSREQELSNPPVDTCFSNVV